MLFHAYSGTSYDGELMLHPYFEHITTIEQLLHWFVALEGENVLNFFINIRELFRKDY
eukprot:UN10895